MAKLVSLAALMAGGSPATLAAAREDVKVVANVKTLVSIAEWDRETNDQLVTQFSERGYDGMQGDARAKRYANVARVTAMQKGASMSTTVLNIQKDINKVLFYSAKANEDTSIPLELADLHPEADTIYDKLQKLTGGFTLDGKEAFLTSEDAHEGNETALVGIGVVVEDSYVELSKTIRNSLKDYCARFPLAANGNKDAWILRLKRHFKTEDEPAEAPAPAGAPAQ